MRFLNFKNGVHIPDKKSLTENIAIEDFFDVDIIELHSKQHIGSPSEFLHKKGEFVKKGQKLSFTSVIQHSPISGEIIDVSIKHHPIYGKNNTILIKNDYKEEKSDEYLNCEKDFLNVSKERLLELIELKGLVGLGGATFPTIRKVTVNKKIELLLINGAECEPYLNIDNRLIIEKFEELKNGILILEKILNPEEIIIGIEKNKKLAIEKLKKIFQSSKIKIVELKTKYPQGGEKQLIQAITKKEVKSKTIPLELGIVVLNVGTVISVFEGVVNGKPLIEKELTISGDGIINKKNLRVKLGTKLKDILHYTGFENHKIKKLILGGPMMGTSFDNLHTSITKGVGALLALSEEESKEYKSRACILCGKCAYVCPMSLAPLQFVKFVDNQMWNKLKDYKLNECINCGACSYICPSNRPLMEAIKIGKAQLRKESK